MRRICSFLIVVAFAGCSDPNPLLSDPTSVGPTVNEWLKSNAPDSWYRVVSWLHPGSDTKIKMDAIDEARLWLDSAKSRVLMTERMMKTTTRMSKHRQSYADAGHAAEELDAELAYNKWARDKTIDQLEIAERETTSFCRVEYLVRNKNERDFKIAVFMVVDGKPLYWRLVPLTRKDLVEEFGQSEMKQSQSQ